MRHAVFFFALVVAASAGAASEITSRELIGTWFGGTSSQGDSRYTFRADHTFDGVDGDAIMAGKWKLHAGKKLELIYFSDYERRIVARDSLRRWFVVTPLSKTRMRLTQFDAGFSPGFQYSSARLWTKRR